MNIKRLQKLLPKGMTIAGLKKRFPIGKVEVKQTLWDLSYIDATVSLKEINRIVKDLKKSYPNIKDFGLKVEAPEIYYESDVSLAEVSVVGKRPETQKEYITRLEAILLAHRERCSKLKLHNEKCFHGWK